MDLLETSDPGGRDKPVVNGPNGIWIGLIIKKRVLYIILFLI
jgi:hypothetical protein